MVESFGIPQQDASLQALRDVVEKNAADLKDVALAALVPVAQAVSQNDANLQSLYSTARRSLQGKINANQTALDNAGGAALAPLAAAVAQNAFDLNAMAASAPQSAPPQAAPLAPQAPAVIPQAPPVVWDGTIPGDFNNLPANTTCSWGSGIVTPPGYPAGPYDVYIPAQQLGFPVAWAQPVGYPSQTISGASVHVGSFPDQASVQAWAQANGGLLVNWQICYPVSNAAPPPPPPPPPPIIVPPPPPPPVILPPIAAYWCLRLPDAAMDAPSTIVQGVSQDDVAKAYPAYLLVGGPFATYADAANSCTQVTTTAPVVTPTPTQTQTQPVSCPEATYSLYIPAPGTKDWCDMQADIKQAIIAMGKAIVDWLVGRMSDSLSTYEGLASQPDPTFSLTDNPIPGLWTLLTRAFGRLEVRIGEPVFNFVCAVQSGFGKIGQCETAPLLYISVVRGLVRILKQFRFGWDAAVWATVDIAVDIDALETALDYFINSLCPVVIPSEAEAIECYLRGTITRDIYECWMLSHSHDPSVFEPVLQARRERPLPREFIEWMRRNQASDSDIINQLRKYGFLQPDEAAQQLTLYDELPSISDHLHWLQRNVYDNEYVETYRLTDGFEERFWANFGNDLRAKGYTKYRARLDYASHWIMPSPTQMQEFLYRSDEIEKLTGKGFNVNDYQRILAEQDYNILARGWFAATAYRVPAISYLKDMFRQGVIDKATLTRYHKRLGYTEEDATHFADIDTIQKSRMRASGGHGWTPAALASAYAIRQKNPQFVFQQMDKLGYTHDEAQQLMDRADIDLQHSVWIRARSRALSAVVTNVKAALSAGIMTVDTARQNLEAMGWPSNWALSLAQSEEQSAKTALVKQVVSAVRKALLRGEIVEDHARGLLNRIGVVPAAVDNYLSLWNLQNTPARKRRTATQAVNDLANGAIDEADALLRLRNLGYEDADQRLYLADAAAKIAKRIAQQQSVVQKNDRLTQRNMAKAVQEAAKQSRQILAKLKAKAPPAKLQKWAELGIINEREFTARLTLYGFTAAEIGSWWTEACTRKAARCNGQAPKP